MAIQRGGIMKLRHVRLMGGRAGLQRGFGRPCEWAEPTGCMTGVTWKRSQAPLSSADVGPEVVSSASSEFGLL